MEEIERAKNHVKIALAFSEKHTGTPAEEITRHSAQALNYLSEANEKVEALIEALHFAKVKVAELHLEMGEGHCHYAIINDALEWAEAEPKAGA